MKLSFLTHFAAVSSESSRIWLFWANDFICSILGEEIRDLEKIFQHPCHPQWEGRSLPPAFSVFATSTHTPTRAMQTPATQHNTKVQHTTQHTKHRCCTQFRRRERNLILLFVSSKQAFPLIQQSNSQSLGGHWDPLAKMMHFCCRTCEQWGRLYLYTLSEASLNHSLAAFRWGRQGIRMGENAKLYIIKVCSVTRGKFPDIHGYPSLISTVTILH